MFTPLLSLCVFIFEGRKTSNVFSSDNHQIRIRLLLTKNPPGSPQLRGIFCGNFYTITIKKLMNKFLARCIFENCLCHLFFQNLLQNGDSQKMDTENEASNSTSIFALDRKKNIVFTTYDAKQV